MEDNENSASVDQTMAILKLQAVMQGHEAAVKILGRCFSRCVDYPGTSLSRTQQQCIWNCSQRILDTQNFVQQRFASARGNALQGETSLQN
ncbi:hypothetical protein IE077_000669 [Cardiosporidium cionae]|uniref:Mitochondrial import inner membrane translocase subunit n=1 Tax=Cardiosporidium cionae TaxID=476202 RepID=A0ABQ7J6U3_9APIC|nr:hypothetical protein IE077_000669 [Cardiosporidium cionae]|eukprot:KAF8819706.1 hypothetical protein IE077_000669 [Cardiosporidium cionae]